MNVKRKIYRIMSVFISAVIFCVFTACGNESVTDNNKLKIVATLFPQYDFAKQITGDNAEVTLLLTPGSESHTYEPTPKDVSKIQQADVFLYIGGESEVWVDEILESAQNKNLKTVRLMDYIEPIEEQHEDDEHEHDEHENEEIEYDEHIFTSLVNSQVLLDEICSVICEEDKENEEVYRQNSSAYSEKIAELDTKFTDMVNNAQRKAVVFGDRFPFAYFAKDYGLDCHAAFSGCSSETEASSATISSLIDIVKKDNIPIVFYIEFSSQSIANKIADACGAKTALLHSCHNISKEDLENGTSYVDLMTQNYQNLSEALN
ncbi:MAG: metal ABC transporter substrate-binding protein [Oscillospiraceae bacterium]|nr:metal ABC transporter substrate-binding protein [Oscillospiraceae bacterium]